MSQATHAHRRCTLPSSGRCLFALLLLTFVNQARSEPAPLEPLYAAAQRFAAEALDVEVQNVTVFPLDRRARVPTCATSLAFDWPFPSRETLRVRCPSKPESLFLRLAVQQTPTTPPILPAATGANTWRLLKAVAAGEALLPTQVAQATVGSPQQGLFHGPWPRDGERFVAVKPLAAGDWVTQPVVRRERLVLEATAPLTAGLRLPHEQLVARWKPALGLPSDTLTPDALPNFVALARPLRAGAVLRKSDLSSATLVPKGSTVTVQIRRGELVLDAELIAEEDGALGERIGVRNPESGRRLSAVVSGPGQAVHD